MSTLAAAPWNSIEFPRQHARWNELSSKLLESLSHCQRQRHADGVPHRAWKSRQLCKTHPQHEKMQISDVTRHEIPCAPILTCQHRQQRNAGAGQCDNSWHQVLLALGERVWANNFSCVTQDKNLQNPDEAPNPGGTPVCKFWGEQGSLLSRQTHPHCKQL